MIIYNSQLILFINKFLKLFKTSLQIEAIMLFGFIFTDQNFLTIIERNHERIHISQYLDLLFLGVIISIVISPLLLFETYNFMMLAMLLLFPICFYYLWYVIEFIIRLFQYRNWSEAYCNICFEREAFRNEDNTEYLTNRKLFNCFKYLLKRIYLK